MSYAEGGIRPQVTVTKQEANVNTDYSVRSDAVVVGMGILGLLIAKRLTDFGQSVTVIDKSTTFPDGASIKNHGWLHTGIAHSLSIEDPLVAARLVNKLQYGHSFLTQYAKECVDDPFTPTYAITKDPELAEKARTRWTASGVPYKELTDWQFQQIEPGLSEDAAAFYFENGDARINNRLLFKKLITDIQRNGGLVLTGVDDYYYKDEQSITLTHQEQRLEVDSPLFFYTTGAGLSDSYKKLTGTALDMRYWKSHLLFLPRITAASTVALDRGAPIVINHGDVSVVNRSYDEVPLDIPDTVVDQREVDLAFDRLTEYYPVARRERDNIHAVACIKPDVASATSARHSVGEKIYEPMAGHIFALPGKMTEAPYVADTVIRGAAEYLNLGDITQRPIDVFIAAQSI